MRIGLIDVDGGKTFMDKLNEHITLYNADCMEVMKTFKDKQFDLAIVDPPY